MHTLLFSQDINTDAEAINEVLNSGVDEVVTGVANDPSILKVWLESLPQKLFDLSIRCALSFIIILLLLYVTKIIRKIIKSAMSKVNADPGTISFADSVTKLLCYGLIILFILVRFGVNAASIVAVIGSLGLTAGLAMQGALQNFAGGIILLFIKPFKVGDFIHENHTNKEGTVIDVGIFYTEILTADNKDVYIPNGVLANSSIENYTKDGYRFISETIGVSYDSDLQKAQRIIRDILNDSYDFEVNDINIFVKSFENSSIKICFRAKVNIENIAVFMTTVFEKIKIEFDKNNIEIPYNKIDVYMK